MCIYVSVAIYVHECVTATCSVLQFINKSLIFSYLLPDIDECLGDNDCLDYANCTNSIGSYSCVCKEGFTGDGTNCTGMLLFNNVVDSLRLYILRLTKLDRRENTVD